MVQCVHLTGALKARWRLGLAVIALHQRSYPTPGLVSTGMGDCSRVQVAFTQSRYSVNHTGQLSLAITSWLGTMSTSDGHDQC